MSALPHLTNRQRIGIAVVLGLGAGMLLALAVWSIVANHERVGEIQRSRIASSELSCEVQNEHHERLFAQIEATASVQRVSEPAKYRGTVAKARELEALLNAIQPEEDCAARAHRLVVGTLGQAHARPRRQLRARGPLRLSAPLKTRP